MLKLHFSSRCIILFTIIRNLKNFISIFIVVAQDYATRVGDAFVIIGNSALMKCDVPSFVADFVSVNSWINDQGQEYFSSNNEGMKI